MDAAPNASDKPCGGVLNSLESIDFVPRETVKQALHEFRREVTKAWTKIYADALSRYTHSAYQQSEYNRAS